MTGFCAASGCSDVAVATVSALDPQMDALVGVELCEYHRDLVAAGIEPGAFSIE